MKTNIAVAKQIEILEANPCPTCNTVRVLVDDPDEFSLIGATCKCGEIAGANERWDIRDIIRTSRPAVKNSRGGSSVAPVMMEDLPA